MESIFDGVVNQNETSIMIQEMRAGNQLVANAVYALNERITQGEKVFKKKRRKQLQSWIVIQNDSFGIVKNFDDGTQEIEAITLNLLPNFEIKNIKFKGFEETTIFAGIYFKEIDFWLIGVKNKMNGKYIYELMLKRGIIFNAKYKGGRIKELLNEFFAPRIAQSKDLIEIPALGGWWNKKFLTAETFMLREEEGIPPLPVQKKSLKEYDGIEPAVKDYFEKLKGIRSWRHRVLIMLGPIKAFLSSIFDDLGIAESTYLNIVFLSDISVRNFCDFLQVFNRKRLYPSEPTIENVLSAKDENLIWDSRSNGLRSKYKQEQYECRCRNLAERIVKRELITEGGYEVNASPVVLSDSLSRSRYAINLLMDENDFKVLEPQKDKDVVGMVLYHLKKYCEEEYDGINRLISLVRKEERNTARLKGALNVAENFWAAYGVDMRKMADLPEKFELSQLSQDMLIMDDDVVRDFVAVMRQGISNWPVKEKRRGEKMENYVSYTEEIMCFPVWIFNDILARNGLLHEKNRFLLALRTAGYLITDDGRSYSRQVKSGDKRIETIQIKRAIFNRLGLADITELGEKQ